jgi:hypothetical protein
MTKTEKGCLGIELWRRAETSSDSARSRLWSSQARSCARPLLITKWYLYWDVQMLWRGCMSTSTCPRSRLLRWLPLYWPQVCDFSPAALSEHCIPSLWSLNTGVPDDQTHSAARARLWRFRCYPSLGSREHVNVSLSGCPKIGVHRGAHHRSLPARPPTGREVVVRALCRCMSHVWTLPYSYLSSYNYFYFICACLRISWSIRKTIPPSRSILLLLVLVVLPLLTNWPSFKLDRDQ